MTDLVKMGEAAVIASREAAKLQISAKNNALLAIADAIVANTDSILTANEKDMEKEHMRRGNRLINACADGGAYQVRKTFV